jgi:L-fuconolactonase
MPEHEEWLNLVNEKALEPELPICDPHHHCWNLVAPVFGVQHYLAADYIKDASGGHNIKQTVVVQSRGNYSPLADGKERTPVDETVMVMEQVAGLKSKIDYAAGFVGYVDLATGKDVQPAIEAHLEAGKKRFKGIRYPLGVPSKPEEFRVMSNPRVHEGFTFLPKYKLTFDLMANMYVFSDMVDIAKKFPNASIVIEHMGLPKMLGKTPEEKDQIVSEWRNKIKLVAPFENIYMKLGATFQTERGFGFDKKPKPPTSEEAVKVVGPYYQFVIEQFGPKRCMFESNFPPDRQGSSFTVIWNAFKLMTKSFSKTERAYMFHDTANKAYNL